MAEPSRLEALRRRVHDDPASVAFAALAEEYRRAGRASDAISTCRAGLAHHPGYVSARVTLGRALAETGEEDDAFEELDLVLQVAPENLAALKTLADLHRRRGEPERALARYRDAWLVAPGDPEVKGALAVLEPVGAPDAGAAPADPPAVALPATPPVASEGSAPRVAPPLAIVPEPPAGADRMAPSAGPEVSQGALAPASRPEDEATPVDAPQVPPADPVVVALEALLEGVKRARVRRNGSSS